jgi:hypothetical protein
MNYFPYPSFYGSPTTEDWYITDQPENYKTVMDSGENNLYKPGDFKYIFNSDGFRCDEFNLSSEIPILFIGCSVTEGVGLPVHDTWSYRLLTKIREKTNKNIPYWNLAKSGSGYDTMSRHLYWFCKTHDVKHVFACFSPSLRRELCYKDEKIRVWGPWWKDKRYDDSIFEILTDKCFGDHQTFRSLMLIDILQKYKNFTIDSTSWDNTDNAQELFDEHFSQMNYFQHTLPQEKRARDGIHFGPTYHESLSDIFWSKIHHYF